eukprot:TRINITY_DN36723_c0_g1_i1.p1 TRINITY_DN36723_c0_g1~~TRINITY_DN36723_c0_g1_i1.p1  ORF type:complete len:260 (+),score=35.93 TRINITY_DN36723_c0_g1_i1:43-822(+)
MKIFAAFTLLGVAEALRTDPCAGLICQSDEYCIQREDESAFCTPIDACANLDCPPNEECRIDPFGNAVCIPNFVVGVQCGGFYCSLGESCEKDEFGIAYCVGGAGVMCGDVVCQPFEVCIVGEHPPYCRPADDCENWYCPPTEVCEVNSLGFAKCLASGPVCGDFVCDVTETCAQDDFGYQYCDIVLDKNSVDGVDGNSRVVIFIVSVIGALVVAMSIRVVCCSGRQQAPDTIQTIAIPVVITPAKDLFPERFEETPSV